MFLALNRFKINPHLHLRILRRYGVQNTFLSEVPGFKNFSLCEDQSKKHVL